MDPNAVDANGNTPLHVALEVGQEVIAALLLHHGVAVEVANNMGRAPLHYAALQVGASALSVQACWTCASGRGFRDEGSALMGEG